MTVEYGILAFFMGIGAILIGALITWYIIHGGLQANGFLTPMLSYTIK